ncbi:MAG: hypothetical protein WKF97_21940 [Chitinophagaceae bacterium]
MIKYFPILFLVITIITANKAFSQQADTAQAAKVVEQIVKEEKSISNSENKIDKNDKKINKALRKAKKQERKMNKALAKAKKQERKKEREEQRKRKKEEKINDLKKDLGTQGSSN